MTTPLPNSQPLLTTQMHYENSWPGFTDAPLTGGLRAVGHRIVHGGEVFSAPVMLTPQVLRQLEALISTGATAPADLSRRRLRVSGITSGPHANWLF